MILDERACWYQVKVLICSMYFFYVDLAGEASVWASRNCTLRLKGCLLPLFVRALGSTGAAMGTGAGVGAELGPPMLIIVL